MSQPQLTSFFANTKRGTRASSKNVKLQQSDDSVTKLKGKSDKLSENDKVSKLLLEVPSVKKASSKNDVESNVKPVDEKENTSEQNENNSCPSPSKRTRRSSRSKSSEKVSEVIVSKTVNPKKRTSVRAKLIEDTIEEAKESPASPSKKAKKSDNVSEATEVAKDLKAKLSAQEVKDKLKNLKGKNKLQLLKEQLKTIEEKSKSVAELQAEADKRKKVLEADEALKKKKEELAAIRAAPAYQRFHNLAAKPDGTLPLPWGYKFLAEIFRCTETIGSMYHNRDEVITVEKLKKGVQTMMRKNFQVEYLKQIKTVFPAAYKYAWEHILGRFGKKTADYEIHITMNVDYRRDTLISVDGDAKGEAVVHSGKLAPSGLTERKNIFHNSLVGMVRKHHTDFCTKIGIQVDDDKVQKFHKDFDVDSCPPVPQAELPPKPEVEKYASAAEVLEKARDLFEANPKVAAAMEKVAQTVAQKDSEGNEKDDTQKVVVEASIAKPVPKALASVPLSLLEKIRAKEAEKKAREMYSNKDEEIKMKRLKRLPELARLIKSVFLSEQKNALKKTFVIQKVFQSYPGFIERDVLTLDVDKLVELTTPWIFERAIQKEVWMKVEKEKNINEVVSKLEEIAKK